MNDDQDQIKFWLSSRVYDGTVKKGESNGAPYRETLENGYLVDDNTWNASYSSFNQSSDIRYKVGSWQGGNGGVDDWISRASTPKLAPVP